MATVVNVPRDTRYGEIGAALESGVADIITGIQQKQDETAMSKALEEIAEAPDFATATNTINSLRTRPTLRTPEGQALLSALEANTEKRFADSAPLPSVVTAGFEHEVGIQDTRGEQAIEQIGVRGNVQSRLQTEQGKIDTGLTNLRGSIQEDLQGNAFQNEEFITNLRGGLAEAEAKRNRTFEGGQAVLDRTSAEGIADARNATAILVAEIRAGAVSAAASQGLAADQVKDSSALSDTVIDNLRSELGSVKDGLLVFDSLTQPALTAVSEIAGNLAAASISPGNSIALNAGQIQGVAKVEAMRLQGRSNLAGSKSEQGATAAATTAYEEATGFAGSPAVAATDDAQAQPARTAIELGTLMTDRLTAADPFKEQPVGTMGTAPSGGEDGLPITFMKVGEGRYVVLGYQPTALATSRVEQQARIANEANPGGTN